MSDKVTFMAQTHCRLLIAGFIKFAVEITSTVPEIIEYLLLSYVYNAPRMTVHESRHYPDTWCDDHENLPPARANDYLLAIISGHVPKELISCGNTLTWHFKIRLWSVELRQKLRPCCPGSFIGITMIGAEAD